MKMFLLVAIAFVMCVPIQAAPDWYVNPPRKVYPRQAYFMEVGASARSYEHAVQAALGSIASQIRSDVRARSNVRRRTTTWGDSETVREDFSSSSMVHSSVELRNFDVAIQAKEGDTYYVLVVINKHDLVTALRNDLRQINSDIESHIQSANTNYESGRITESISLLLDINGLIWRAEEKIEIIGSIVELEDSDRIFVSTKELEDMIRNAVGSVKIEEISGDGQRVAAGARLTPLTVRVTDKNGNPLTRVEVGFHKGTDKPIVVYTDEKGEAAFSMRAENTFGRDRRVMAKVIFPFPSRLLRQLENALTVDFSYVGIIKDPLRFDIEVKTRSIPQASSAELREAIIDQLLKIGITHQEGAARKIVVDVSGVREADIVSMGRMVRVSVHADMKIFRGANLLGKFNYSSVGTGSDEVRAFNAAAGNFRVKSDEIASVVFDVEQHSKKPVIIIAGFEMNNVYYSGVGNAFRNMLVSAMSATGEFTLVERTVLDRIFEEMRLSQTIMMDGQNAIEIGKMVSGDYIVTGRISAVSSRIEVDVRMINIETGVVEATASQTLRNTGELRFAANKIAEKLIR